jgi:hypothetical protein
MDSIVYFVGFEEKRNGKALRANRPCATIDHSNIGEISTTTFTGGGSGGRPRISYLSVSIAGFDQMFTYPSLDSHRCESHCEGLLYKAGHRIFLEWSSNRPVLNSYQQGRALQEMEDFSENCSLNH